MSTPVKPSRFHPELAPNGVEVRFYSAWRDRPLLHGPARLAVVHTNAAQEEGDLDSASSWAERNVSDPDPDNSYTIPHYQVDRNGRARKILPTNRRGIANSTGDDLQARDGHEDVSWFSLAIETADTGTNHDATISAFTAVQAETIATIIAYESILHGYPIALPATWYGTGVGSHTDPFPYPAWTTKRGKTCPGLKKKAQVRNLIIPRARQIKDAWSGADPEPPPPVSVPMVMKFGGTPTAGWGGWYSVDGGKTRHSVADMAGARHMTVTLEAVDAVTRRRPTDPWNWTDVSHTTDVGVLDRWLIPNKPVPPPPPPPPPPPTGGTVLLYKVKSGDSYWSIAATVHADGKATAARVAAIQAANGAKALQPGDLINIPGRVT
jgi:hypothetical protein